MSAETEARAALDAACDEARAAYHAAYHAAVAAACVALATRDAAAEDAAEAAFDALTAAEVAYDAAREALDAVRAGSETPAVTAELGEGQIIYDNSGDGNVRIVSAKPECTHNRPFKVCPQCAAKPKGGESAPEKPYHDPTATFYDYPRRPAYLRRLFNRLRRSFA